MPRAASWDRGDTKRPSTRPTLSEASITALALEESLLREWSEFHDRVEQRRTPPTTREDIEQFSDYVRNDAFVDSVVDALSLYLADRNEFDFKFGSYLDLMLIQRATPEDIAILTKLAAKYASAGDVVTLMGLLHRLQLFAGDVRLGPAIDICTSALSQVKDVADIGAWARTIGVEPTQDSWTFSLKLGTAPPNYWYVRKSDLQQRDVALDLLVNDAQWRVQVARVDRNYSAQWRPSGITVDTDETKLKALSAWPKLVTPQLFPIFASTLAQFLRVQWARSAWTTSNAVVVNKSRLVEWLHANVDEVQP